MRPVLSLAALATLVIVAVAACSDDDPLRLSEGDQARVAFRPQLNSFGASAMLPINLIRLTVEEHPGGAQLMDPVEVVVEPTDPAWNVSLEVPLPGGAPVDVIVVIELINETDGVRTVEWSGQVGPLSLEPGPNGSAPEVEMFRGSRANLTITAVATSADTTLSEGDALLLRATATGATGVPVFFWSSLDPLVAALDSAAGDSATFVSLLPGVARIVVEAGPRADTLELTVLARVTALEISPAQDTLDALMAQAQFAAAGLDTRGDTVSGVVIDWTSSDTTIARSLGGGAFLALGTGTATITASSPVAPGVTATATLTVRQVADSVAITPPLDTIPAGGSSALFAAAFDANGNAIVGAVFAWSSSDTSVATVDASGVVTAVDLGTAQIRAGIDAVQAVATIEVVPGEAALVEVTPDSLAFASIGEVATLSATETDAFGNPTGTPITWSTRDSGIATVTAAGEVGAVANGSTWIVAAAGTGSDSAFVEVAQMVASVAVSAPLDTIAVGESMAAAAQAFDTNGNPVAGATFAWSSSDATIAAVDAAGVVSGNGLGDAFIRAISGTAADSVLVTVVAGSVDSVDVTPDSLAFVSLGDSAALVATGFDVGGNPAGGTAAWLSRDAAVASVSAAGVVTAVGNGATWILGTIDGIADSTFVEVAQVVGSVAVSAPLDTIAVGDSMAAAAQAFDANGNAIASASFAWTSSDTAAATVDAAGVVTGVAPGSAWIRASSGVASDSVAVTVVAAAPSSLAIVSGDAQSAEVATTLPDSLVVLVEDAFGNPVSGVVVDWSTGSGSLSPASTTTDAAGLAAAAWTLGQAAGAQSATASHAALSAAFNATASAGAVDSVDVQPDSLAFTVIGATDTLTAGSFDQFGNDCGCTASWFSRDASIATVDAAGVVTAMANGATWIVADIASIQDSAFVQVGVARAAGATIFWSGATSSDWLDGTNWNTSAVPASTDVVYVSAGRPNHPVLSAADTIAGLIVEDGSSLTIQDSLVVVDGDVRAGNTIVGTGVLHMVGITDNRFLSGTVPSAILEVVRIDSATTVDGTLIVRGVGAAVAPSASLHVTGDVIVEEGIGGLSLEGPLTVDGSMQLLGGLDLLSGGTVTIADSLYSAGFGGLRMNDASNLIRVGGNVRLESDFSTDGLLTVGTIEVAGDWFSDGHAWHASGTDLVLNGTAAPQNVTLLNAGHGPGQGHLAGLHVQNPFGASLLTPNLVHGDLVAAGPLTADSLIIEGVLDAAGDVSSPQLMVKGIAAVGGGYSVPTTVYFSEFGDPLIIVTSGIPYADLVVTADSAALGGDVFVSGSVFVDGAAVVDLMLRGNRLDVGGNLSVVNGLLHLTNAADTVAVVGSASFTGAVSSAATLTAGVVEVGGDLLGDGAAFDVTGTTFVLNGAGIQAIETPNSGPITGFSRFHDLVIAKPSGEVRIESHVFTADLLEQSGIAVRDTLSIFTLAAYGDVNLAGDLQLAQLAVQGQLSIGGLLDVDEVDFFGENQIIPTAPAYRSVEVLGTGATWAGPDSISGNLTAWDGLTLGGSLEVAGHAAIAQVDLAGFRLGVGSMEGGDLFMTQPSDSLVVHGAALFDVPPFADPMMSDGVVIIESGGSFLSIDDGFRSIGTALVMRGDSLGMSNAGPAAGQGQLADLQIDASQLTILGSLYIAGDLEDVAALGSTIAGATGTELVQVMGDVLLDSTSVTLNHLVIGDSLVVGPVAGFGVDTVQFIGSGQVIPVLEAGTFNPLSYEGTILVTGSDVHLGADSAFLDLNDPFIVRGAGTTLTIHSAIIDGPNPRIGSLHVAEGDASTRVLLDAFINVDDSVRIDAGVLDLNDRGMFIGSSLIATHGFQTAGTGVLEMDQPSDYLEVAAGATLFTGGSTAGLLTMGSIFAHGDFYSENDAFRSMGTSVSVSGGLVTMWNGGPGAGQGGFADLVFGQFSTMLVGSVYVADDISDNADGVQLTAAPGYSLEVGDSVNLTFGASMTLPRLVVHGSLRRLGGTYDVDVTEFAGFAQVIDSVLPFDTMVVTGSALRPIRPFFPPNVIARVVIVDGGSLALRDLGDAVITDSLIVQGAGASFDPSGTNLVIGSDTASEPAALVTIDGSLFIMNNGESVTVNGPVDFAGGPTGGLLTSGTLTVRGDFTASGGAFQASGTHVTNFETTSFAPPAITLSMPNGGVGSGADHFNDVGLLWWGSDIIVATDLYALGDVSSSSDFFTTLIGSGQRILSDGWNLGGGLDVVDLALEMDEDLNPFSAASVNVSGITFRDYPSGVTRLRISHPGQDASFFFGGLDFTASEEPGLYLDAIDSNHGDIDSLAISVTFSVGQPADWASRKQTDGVASISP